MSFSFSRTPQNPKFDLFSVKYLKPGASCTSGNVPEDDGQTFLLCWIRAEHLALFMNTVIIRVKFTVLK